jgi:flagellar protein FlbD
MILVTRLNGLPFAVNPDLLERVEASHDTVLTLIDGTKYLVAESVAEVIELVRDYRASIVASARVLAARGPRDEPELIDNDHAETSRPRKREPHLHLAAAPTPVEGV